MKDGDNLKKMQWMTYASNLKEECLDILISNVNIVKRFIVQKISKDMKEHTKSLKLLTICKQQETSQVG